MVEEIWRPIANYEGLYEISDYGSVRSLPGRVFSRDGRVMKRKGGLLKTHKRGRYTNKTLYKDTISKNYTVHRLVALAFIPNPENKLHINHIDNNRYNNHVNNLEWVTQKENLKHAYDQGRMSKPPVNYVSQERLKQAKELLDQGINRTEIAKRLNMSRHTMYNYFGSDKDFKAGKTIGTYFTTDINSAVGYRNLTGKKPAQAVKRYVDKSGKQQTAHVACYPVDFLPVIENAIELGFGS